MTDLLVYLYLISTSMISSTSPTPPNPVNPRRAGCVNSIRHSISGLEWNGLDVHKRWALVMIMLGTQSRRYGGFGSREVYKSFISGSSCGNESVWLLETEIDV